jgi:hypothetical protein
MLNWDAIQICAQPSFGEFHFDEVGTFMLFRVFDGTGMAWVGLFSFICIMGLGLNEMTDLSDQLGQTACHPLAEFEFGRRACAA